MIDTVIPKLPNIDVVEVLDLGGEFPSISCGFINSSRNTKIEGELAQTIANLFRQLTPGESARCHTPPFGLRFYFNKQLVLQASICWECDNMYIWKDDNRLLYGLNLQQPSSKHLLALLKDSLE